MVLISVYDSVTFKYARIQIRIARYTIRSGAGACHVKKKRNEIDKFHIQEALEECS